MPFFVWGDFQSGFSELQEHSLEAGLDLRAWTWEDHRALEEMLLIVQAYWDEMDHLYAFYSGEKGDESENEDEEE